MKLVRTGMESSRDSWSTVDLIVKGTKMLVIRFDAARVFADLSPMERRCAMEFTSAFQPGDRLPSLPTLECPSCRSDVPFDPRSLRQRCPCGRRFSLLDDGLRFYYVDAYGRCNGKKSLPKFLRSSLVELLDSFKPQKT